MNPMMIYIAGPITHNFIGGLIDACDIGAKLIERGHVPYLPHAMIFINVRTDSAALEVGGALYEKWLKFDLRVIDKCDALFRLRGESAGADREVAYAASQGKIVYTSTANIPYASL